MISIERVQYWKKKTLLLTEKYQLRVQKNMSLRLGVGLLGMGLLIVIALLKAPIWLILVWCLDIIYFCYLVLVHRNLKKFIQKLALLEDFFHRQELRANGLFSNPKAFAPPLKEELDILSQDFHLFGEKSIFEFIDESVTPYGEKNPFSMV